MKLEAMKRQAGRPSKENSCQVGTHLRSDQELGEQVGESARTVQRYIRLTYLIPELLEKVDNKEIAFNPAVEISYLTEDEQRDFLEALDYSQASPSLSQAQEIKRLSQKKARAGDGRVMTTIQPENVLWIPCVRSWKDQRSRKILR